MNRKYADGYPQYLKDSYGKVILDHPEYNWWLTMARYYDLDYETISGILHFQDHTCPICIEKLDLSFNHVKKGTGKFRYYLDHDHMYGNRSSKNRPGIRSIRGFLCRQCNEIMKSIDLIHKNHVCGVSLLLDEESPIGRYIRNPPAQRYLLQHSRVLI